MLVKYPLTGEELARLQDESIYHRPTLEQAARYQEIRDLFSGLKQFLLEHCPRSRELSHALTLLDDANYNANASIARHEKGEN